MQNQGVTNHETPLPGTPAGDLYGRIRGAVTGTLELMSIQLGRRLGLYDALAEPATASELAGRTGTNARMVREWLEQQAVAGFVELEEAERYRLPEATREAFTDAGSLAFAAPMAEEATRVVGRLADLEQAFRTGRGIEQPYHWVEGRPDGTRSAFLQQLGTTWLPGVPDVHQRLGSGPPARVADIGVGSGWSSIAMALAYPDVRVDGYDLDEIAIGYARKHAEEAGVSDRVTFRAGDASTFDSDGRYDLVTVFEAVHDLSRPVTLLTQARMMLAEGGSVIIADERVPDRLEVPGSAFDRYIYGWSVMNCLPAAMTDPGSANTGAVMRPDTLRRYATEAGFAEMEILPIDHFEWRFYRLLP
jgi:2-polyprenyl-3-methyl-5-hydroxy-6-metoxy-1,4-benzoquinol methylase